VLVASICTHFPTLAHSTSALYIFFGVCSPLTHCLFLLSFSGLTLGFRRAVVDTYGWYRTLTCDATKETHVSSLCDAETQNLGTRLPPVQVIPYHHEHSPTLQNWRLDTVLYLMKRGSQSVNNPMDKKTSRHQYTDQRSFYSSADTTQWLRQQSPLVTPQ
jgi:hypothetical protein